MIIKFFINIFKKIFLNSYEKKFIYHNINNYSYLKKNLLNKERKDVILVDFFNHPPFIYFWSHVVNFLLKKHSIKSEYFFFILYRDFFTKFKLNFLIKIKLRKMRKIYSSFNVEEGISELNFNYSRQELVSGEKAFSRIYNKELLLKYKYKNIKIGDLIYDTYLRTTYSPTVNFDDKYLLEIFLRARKIFDKIEDYFLKNNVKLVIPSHTYYIQYGILVRFANNKKIPIIMIHSKSRGNKDFRLKVLDKNFPTENNDGYLEYPKKFKSLKENKKKIALKLAKSNLLNRLTGKSKLSYLKKSPYTGHSNKNSIVKNSKRNVIIFCHDFFDAPHRFRKMIFNDFYEQLNFFINFSKNYSKYNWFIKPHPNHLSYNDRIFESLKTNKNIIFLNKEIDNYQIIKSNPKFIITNNGTVAHEFAFFKIPVINTGDNPHIKYNFNLHPKNLIELKNMILKIDYYKKKINFKKNKIYEFVYMHYLYQKKDKEISFIKDDYFASKKISINSTSRLFNMLMMNKKKLKNIDEYLEYFFKLNKNIINPS
jgi:hypothetical protein